MYAPLGWDALMLSTTKRAWARRAQKLPARMYRQLIKIRCGRAARAVWVGLAYLMNRAAHRGHTVAAAN